MEGAAVYAPVSIYMKVSASTGLPMQCVIKVFDLFQSVK